MPERRQQEEMEYVPVGNEAAEHLNSGLRLLIEQLLLRLLRHVKTCPDCQPQLQGNEAQERVIEF